MKAGGYFICLKQLAHPAKTLVERAPLTRSPSSSIPVLGALVSRHVLVHRNSSRTIDIINIFFLHYQARNGNTKTDKPRQRQNDSGPIRTDDHMDWNHARYHCATEPT